MAFKYLPIGALLLVNNHMRSIIGAVRLFLEAFCLLLMPVLGPFKATILARFHGSSDSRFVAKMNQNVTQH